MNSTTLAYQAPSQAHENRLKLLSYNVQVGISSHSYRDYVTQSWRHILPDSRRQANLTEVAHWLSDFDIVALQEVDAGSMRTHFVNQVAYLAQKGGFPHWHHQQNRRIGRLAAHSNGILTRLPVEHIVHHKLPGRIAGRGALQAIFGHGEEQLSVLSVHLALSPQARRKQLAYLSDVFKDEKYFIIMGDMNCPLDDAQEEFTKQGLKVKLGDQNEPTFPRWKPRLQLDHIWVSENLNIVNCEVMDLGVSDHLPISMEIEIPESLANLQPQPKYALN